MFKFRVNQAMNRQESVKKS